jgi:hypothetical protein
MNQVLGLWCVFGIGIRLYVCCIFVSNFHQHNTPTEELWEHERQGEVLGGGIVIVVCFWCWIAFL